MLFEPIDNITMASADDHRARLHWLETLWTPPAPTDSHGAWADWRARLEEASVFGQRPLIRSSLQRCSGASVAFGLKARLSRLLTHATTMRGLRELMARRGVRVIRLSRRNRIKQALAEYRRLHAGLGQFRAAAGADQADPKTAAEEESGRPQPQPPQPQPRPAVLVEMHLFRESLKAVERSHRLAEKVLVSVPAEPRLSLDYERLLTEHASTLEGVGAFLRLARSSGAAATAAAGRAYVKATPDQLCAAVSNYGELCTAYGGSAYARFFEEPCDCDGGGGRGAGASMVSLEAARRGRGRGAGVAGPGLRRGGGRGAGLGSTRGSKTKSRG